MHGLNCFELLQSRLLIKDPMQTVPWQLRRGAGSPPAMQRERAMSQAFATARSTPRSLIIAERARNIRHLLRRELSRDGFEITVLSSAQDLCRSLESQPRRQIILLDPDLPDLDDAILIQRLRIALADNLLLLHSYGAQLYPPLADITTATVRRTGDIEALRATLKSLFEES